MSIVWIIVETIGFSVLVGLGLASALGEFNKTPSPNSKGHHHV